MLSQKCSHKNNIEIQKKPKSKKKTNKQTTKVCNVKKQEKGKLPAENADIWWRQ